MVKNSGIRNYCICSTTFSEKSQICFTIRKIFFIFFSEYQKPYSNCLREVSVPIVGFKECQQMYENDPSRIKVLKGTYAIYKYIVENKNKYLTVGWGTKAQCFCPPYFKTWFFYVVFNAELNGTIRILCFHRAIIDCGLAGPSWATVG